MDIPSQKQSLEDDLVSELHFETEKRKYDWVSNAEGISWESFSATFPKHRLWFYTLLDISLDDGTGWQQLAQNFGLNADQIKWCSKYCGPAGPTAAVFSKLQQQKLTDDGIPLYHLLKHLISLGRHDLLSRIPWQQCIDQLKEEACKLQAVSHNLALNERDEVECKDANVVSFSASFTPSQITSPKKKTTPYACSILMIYANDSSEFATKLYGQLRSSNGRGRIGVLVLQEQQHLLMQDPNSLLYKWFTQVDYIVPVLSPDLLSQISGWSAASETSASAHGHVTALLNRYVYRLTLDQYVALASRNKRCRPVVSATHSREVCSTELVRTQGLLQVVTVCDDYDSSGAVNNSVEKFAHLLLKTHAISS
ncbi:uncharacterized protein LOC108669345 [Hyalella azteca]|uniref:Uncharacterized protein LOC108669345 n=1 Tax=Hyalella azteca TaxID=294128 RepID=A0A8B7NEV1_HYAAZ|nr:uncharacterized protein LOC108669345 [Hyalella azteca]